MNRYLIYTAPGSGHLYPLIPTMQELRRRGHDVHVRTEASAVPGLERLEIAAKAIHQGIEQRADDTWQAKTPVGALRRSIAMYVDRAHYEVGDLQQALGTERPDAVLLDNNCWGAAAAAQSAGIPWAQAATFLLPLVTRDAPPFGLGLKPARGWPGKLRDEAIRRTAVPLFDRQLPPVNRLRTELGLDPVRHVSDLYMLAPLVLSYTAEPLEYPRPSLPPSVCMVGPGSWDPAETEPEPAWLAALTRPVILVSISTVFQDDGELIQTALDALADEPYDVVVTTASLDPASFRRPPNAHVHRFVPHSHVLRRAVAVVSPGGMGLTQKALMAGVPLCVVPFGRDQLEVARRVLETGAGTRVSARSLSPRRLRTAILAAIARAPAAKRVGERFWRAGGALAAADALEHLVKGG